MFFKLGKFTSTKFIPMPYVFFCIIFIILTDKEHMKNYSAQQNNIFCICTHGVIFALQVLCHSCPSFKMCALWPLWSIISKFDQWMITRKCYYTPVTINLHIKNFMHAHRMLFTVKTLEISWHMCCGQNRG